MRRLFAWTAGLVGIAALARVLARRQARHEQRTTPSPPPAATDPAEELRRKLSDTRTEAPVLQDGDPQAATPAEPTETIDERRARVHAKAQEAIEAMQEPQE